MFILSQQHRFYNSELNAKRNVLLPGARFFINITVINGTDYCKPPLKAPQDI
jgi:hypothetical protein